MSIFSPQNRLNDVINMKEFLKRSGIIFIVAGIAVLAITELSKMESNQMLIISGGLIVFGLALYVVLNNVID
jgi:uncharacterized protein YjeT (DUF2065 family)